MLRNLFSVESLKGMLYMIPAILVAITCHEFAHGFVSYRLGDPTPKRDGRLSLNPLAHLDIVGTLCLLLFGMGWAKPVQINPGSYKSRKVGTVLVSLAGPLMNYLLAFLGLLLYVAVNMAGYGGIWFFYLAAINIGLGTFNLIPVPPLDGSHVLEELVPGVRGIYGRVGRFAMPILVLCLYTGILKKPLDFVNDAVLGAMARAALAIFGA